MCAVTDDIGRVLLSRRGDLDVWNLPGGRLDYGERLEQAAAREAREETGLIVHIDRAVGLYYLAGWGRMNILYGGWPLGGEVRSKTDETRANRFFTPDRLPEMFLPVTPLDALAGARPTPRVIAMPPGEIRRIKRALRWRWVKNLLSGRPEPRFAVFDVQAVGLIWTNGHRRVLTVPENDRRTLPRVTCDGHAAPWDELTLSVKSYGLNPEFHWVGVRQEVGERRFEFVFAATLPETEPRGQAEWSTARNAALSNDHDAAYVERVKSTYASDPVWSLTEDAENVYLLEAAPDQRSGS